MQRDLYLPRLVADIDDEPPLAALVDPAYGAEHVYFVRGGAVDEPTFARLVPPARRVAILNMATGVSVVYDVSELVDLIEDVDEDDEYDGYGEPQWIVTQPAPRVEISDDDQGRILERAREAAVTQPSTSVPEPDITTSVIDPTPRCEILPRGSDYNEVYDFTDFDVGRDEFERDVPPSRRAVIRSGTSTTAYDAEQLVRAAKGVIGNSRRIPSSRTYVLSTRTGSCTLDRNGYVDLLQRASAADVVQEPLSTETAVPREPERVPQPAPQVAPTQQQQPPARQSQQAVASAASAAASMRRAARAESATAPTVPFEQLTLRQPRLASVMAPTTRQRPTAAPQATSVSRMGPSLGRYAPLAPMARTAGAESLGGVRAPRPLAVAGPSTVAASGPINQRIHDAVGRARDGALVRFLGSPDFIQTMSASLAIDILANALVQDFVARQASGDSDSALPIALASLGVRSYSVPALSEALDAALLDALGQADALGLVGVLTRAGFAPSDNAIIRSVVYRLSMPRRDTETAMRILEQVPMSDLLNYRRVLAAAARLGVLPVARYVVESILRDTPLGANDALALANIAAGANQHSIESLFLSLAQPASPVPVSADYREREREYRGTF
ncbi:hypothetical protein pmac_cds_170 [Pandoravirus macleodensis]|uniref:Uncharacterized protein n=1 Tax=Pandoravirus macleodensis TaxID=2107707 RepID=A0A2U7UEG2_9VIRU|nr:hypothetical protein pmac_cds_170 [Pandoravirus macleodensis]AVK76858.1 hypothetical protein pmac_cds_170 [Pandoravirus macleodensis]